MSFFTRVVAPAIVMAGTLLCGLPLLAQPSAPSIGGEADPFGGYGTLGAMLGNTGFLLWFAWYTVTKTMPKQQEAFGVQLEKERAIFQQVLDARQRESEAHLSLFMAELRTERESRVVTDTKVADSINNLADKIHAMGK